MDLILRGHKKKNRFEIFCDLYFYKTETDPPTGSALKRRVFGRRRRLKCGAHLHGTALGTTARAAGRQYCTRHMEAPEPDEDATPEEGFIFVLEKATLETAKVGKVRRIAYLLPLASQKHLGLSERDELRRANRQRRERQRRTAQRPNQTVANRSRVPRCSGISRRRRRRRVAAACVSTTPSLSTSPPPSTPLSSAFRCLSPVRVRPHFCLGGDEFARTN